MFQGIPSLPLVVGDLEFLSTQTLFLVMKDQKTGEVCAQACAFVGTPSIMVSFALFPPPLWLRCVHDKVSFFEKLGVCWGVFEGWKPQKVGVCLGALGIAFRAI